MRCIRILLFLSLIYIHRSYAETEVSGVIAADATWTLTGSPYIVTDDVFVNTGVTLAIEPGVSVRFSKNQALIVDGLIRAVGTATNYILFEPDTTGVPADFWWGGILLRNQAVPYDFNNQTGCFFQYCRLIYSGTPNLILDPSGNTSFTIYSAVSLGMDQCEVDNSSCGITAASGSRIYGTLFKECTADAFSGPLIKVGQNSEVSFNLFYKCAVAVSTGMMTVDKNINAFSNLFIENEFVFYESLFIKENSQFHHNSFVDNIGIMIEVQGGSVYNNTFTRNQVDIQMVRLNNCVPDFHGNNLFENTSNVFGSEVEIAATAGSGSPGLIQSNYWGSSDSSVISTFVEDQADDTDLCQLDFVPFDVVPPPEAPCIPPVSVLKKDLLNGSISVTWNPVSNSDLKGYKVYWGGFTGYSFANSVTVTGDTTVTLSGVSVNEIIGVTAIDVEADDSLDQFEGHESWFTYATIIVGQSQVLEAALPGFNVYPNPSDGAFLVQWNAAERPVLLTVFNSLGDVVSEDFHYSTAEVSFFLDQPGVYFVRAVAGTGVIGYRKISVQ